MGPQGDVTYGDVFHQNEVEMSTFNFEHADVDALFAQFDQCEKDSMPTGCRGWLATARL